MDTSHTDCRDEVGITVGLIDSVISILRVLKERDLTPPDAEAALQDLLADPDLMQLLQPTTWTPDKLREVANVLDASTDLIRNLMRDRPDTEAKGDVTRVLNSTEMQNDLRRWADDMDQPRSTPVVTPDEDRSEALEEARVAGEKWVANHPGLDAANGPELEAWLHDTDVVPSTGLEFFGGPSGGGLPDLRVQDVRVTPGFARALASLVKQDHLPLIDEAVLDLAAKQMAGEMVRAFDGGLLGEIRAARVVGRAVEVDVVDVGDKTALVRELKRQAIRRGVPLQARLGPYSPS